LTEAVKVTTLRFLDEAPAPPPKSPFALFLHEKRKASELEGRKTSKTDLKTDVEKGKKEWLKMDRLVRVEYEEKRKELIRTYEDDVKTFMRTERWQEYVKEAKRLRIPVTSLLMHKKKVIKKLQKGMKASPSSIPLPKKPETFPDKPRAAFQVFTAENRSAGPLAEIAKLWQGLDENERERYEKVALEERRSFEQSMYEFKKSEDGKAYHRELNGALRRRRLLLARNKYLDDMPKKPASAVGLWMRANLASFKKANPNAPGVELKTKMHQAWSELDDSDRRVFEEKAEQQQEEYAEKMEAFKKSDNWTNYIRASKPKAKKKAKMAKRAVRASPAPRKPESMPKKPLIAFQLFVNERGAKGSNNDLAREFQELPSEEKQKYTDEAAENLRKYHEEKEKFNASDEGRKYNRSVQVFQRRLSIQNAKAKFLIDEPKRPMSAPSIFMQEMRSKVMADNPELKGSQVNHKMLEIWKQMSEEEKQEFTDKEASQRQEYERTLQEFQQSENYQKYQVALRKLSGKPKPAQSRKRKNMEPPKPENLPKKPPQGIMLFFASQRSQGKLGDSKTLSNDWLELGAEGQKEYLDKAAELTRQYEEDLKAFQKSAEGKKYFRERESALRRQRIQKAKIKYLGNQAVTEPKKPMSPYFIFIQENRHKYTGMKSSEASQKLTEMWGSLPDEERQVYLDKEKIAKAQYDEDMKAYKESQEYKNFSRAVSTITGERARKAKAKARAKAAARRGRGKSSDSDSDSDAMGSDSDDSSSSSDSDSD